MSQLFTAAQIKEWDQYTIEQEPITAINLMERAATAFVNAWQRRYPHPDTSVTIFAGSGNNGGDALAIARLLHLKGYPVVVYSCSIGPALANDCVTNLQRLQQLKAIPVHYLKANEPFPEIAASTILIDGVFGTGLNRPITGYWATMIQWLNTLPIDKIAIDIPSGLPAEGLAFGPAIQADLTISFERPKLSFLMPENQAFTGTWQVVPIGLDSTFVQKEPGIYALNTYPELRQMIRNRKPFDHKGKYGHALLMAGSYGMMGAAQLCGRACLRSGTGLVTMYLPTSGYLILQSSLPEAMAITDPAVKSISQLPDLSPYAAIGIGPGIGQAASTASVLWQLITQSPSPLVIDADALNILAKAPEKITAFPPNSILTPHPGEFRRLTGKSLNSWESLQVLSDLSQRWQVTIVLKGAYTRIALPDGRLFFNTTGNPGMATGGSGDVLTGLLCGLLAQGYTAEQAARIGVYLHGSAGDLAEQAVGSHALIASDIIHHLGQAFIQLLD